MTYETAGADPHETPFFEYTGEELARMVAGADSGAVKRAEEAWKELRHRLMGDDGGVPGGLLRDLERAVEEVLEYWSGDAADRFHLRAREIIDGLGRIAPYLRHVEDALRAAGEALTTHQSALTSVDQAHAAGPAPNLAGPALNLDGTTSPVSAVQAADGEVMTALRQGMPTPEALAAYQARISPAMTRRLRSAITMESLASSYVTTARALLDPFSQRLWSSASRDRLRGYSSVEFPTRMPTTTSSLSSPEPAHPDASHSPAKDHRGAVVGADVPVGRPPLTSPTEVPALMALASVTAPPMAPPDAWLSDKGPHHDVGRGVTNVGLPPGVVGAPLISRPVVPKPRAITGLPNPPDVIVGERRPGAVERGGGGGVQGPRAITGLPQQPEVSIGEPGEPAVGRGPRDSVGGRGPADPPSPPDLPSPPEPPAGGNRNDPAERSGRTAGTHQGGAGTRQGDPGTHQSGDQVRQGGAGIHRSRGGTQADALDALDTWGPGERHPATSAEARAEQAADQRARMIRQRRRERAHSTDQDPDQPTAH